MTEKKIDVALKKIMKWKIIESWKYDELIQQKWKFYNLANPDKLVLW
jgi:hypothetical protein